IARLQEQESQKAVATAGQIVAKSREAAEQDYARMLAELKEQVGGLVVQTTAMVSGKVLTAEDQRRLTEETEKQLAAYEIALTNSEGRRTVKYGARLKSSSVYVS